MRTDEQRCPRCGGDDVTSLLPLPGARQTMLCLACLSRPDGDETTWSASEPLDLHEFAIRQSEYLDQGQQQYPVALRRVCGHDEVLDLPVSYDAQGLTLLQQRRCGPCVEAWETAMREAAAIAGRRAQELGLPELAGSPKQVDWANQLRVQAIDRHGLDQVGAVIDTETSAKWWIDHRQRLAWLKVFREHKPTSA